MFGTHFVYILYRENGICHKLGASSDFPRRINDLNREHGPFCFKRSIIMRTDNKDDAFQLETALKCSYSGYNTPLPGHASTNGKSEWYADECFDEMRESLSFLAKVRMGEGFSVSNISPEIIKLTTTKTNLKQKSFQTLLDQIKPQITALCENTKNVKDFRIAVKVLIPNLIGVAKLPPDDDANYYEVLLRGDTSREDLDTIFKASRLSADNNEVWAGANLCTSLQTSPVYCIAKFSTPHNAGHFESSWESKGKLSTFISTLEDLRKAFPVPPAFKEYIGKSFLADLALEDARQYRDAIWECLFNLGNNSDPDPEES